LEDRGRTAQLAAPVRQLTLERLALEPLPLPDRIVRVLDRQLRERGGSVLTERRVQGAELAEEDAERPAVGDDVMQREHEDVLLRSQTQQQHPQQRPARQIEGPFGLRAGPALRLALALLSRQLAQIEHRERDSQLRG